MTLPPSSRRDWIAAALALTGLQAGLQARPAAAAAAPLRLALAPFLSPAALLSAFKPLRDHLERALQRSVEMLSARDFVALVDAARQGHYDLVQLPAHLARLAMIDWKFQMVAAPEEPVQVVIAVKAGGPVRSAAMLKGQAVGMLDALSLTATVGRRWLQDQGLAAEVQVVAQPSVNSAMFALDRGEVAAVVAAQTQFAALPLGTPRGETVLARIGGMSAPIYVAAPHMQAAELGAVRAAMVSFTPDAARPATAANSRLRPVPDAQLATLDPLVAIVRQALIAPR